MSLLARPVTGTDALVLRTWPCGETSAVVSLLTRDHGFVKVLAKAARRQRSRLRPLVEPGRLVHAEFTLDPARELQYLRGGEVRLDPLARDATLERSAYLLGALELVDRCRPAAEATAAAGLFEVCEDFLAVLSSPACRQPALLFFGLEWRLLAGHGTAPRIRGCACCGGPAGEPGGGPLRFDPAEGGLVCGNCVTDGAATGGRPVSREALALLCDLETTELAGLADGELAPERRREVGALLHRFLGYHLPGYQLPAALDLLRAGRDGGS